MRRGCRHYPPNWRWVGDTYRNTREIVRWTSRDGTPLEDLIATSADDPLGLKDPLRETAEYARMVESEGRWYVETTCAYGQCSESWCPVCGCYKMGWGPIMCPCADTVCWPDMRPLPPGQRAPVKPSVMRRRRRRQPVKRRSR